MDIETLRKRAKRDLAEFSEGKALREGQWVRQDLNSEAFPVPDLVLFGLTQLLGFDPTSPGDKVRWQVDADFKGVPFSVSLRKFGFQLSFPSAAPIDHGSALVAGLRRAAKLAAEPLASLASQQIEDGNVTLANQFYSFDSAYKYFRGAARRSYGRRPTKKSVGNDSSFAGLIASLLPAKKAVTGSYLAGAMLEAYFSRLEHLLVLVLPFTDFDPASGRLKSFVGDTWDLKFKSVFSLASDSRAEKAYQRLRGLMDELRNPRSHGGFLKNGASFFFHSPGTTMALPATLRSYDLTSYIETSHIPPADFNRVCGELDAVDAFLKTSKIAFGLRFVEAGLDPVFSPQMRAVYTSSMSSDESFSLFLEAENQRQTDFMNFDD